MQTLGFFFSPPLIFFGEISDVIQFKAWDRSNGAVNGANSNDGLGVPADRPMQLSSLGGTVEDYTLSADEKTAYLIGNQGFSIVDISNPESPMLLGRDDSFSISHHYFNARVWLSADEQFAFFSDGSTSLKVFDIRDSSQPTLVTNYETEYITIL